MRTLFGISTIFLMVGLLLAPGCAFAAEFSTSDNSASDFKLSASSEKISPEVRGGGSRGGSSSSSSSKAVKKADGDDDDGTDDGTDSGFPWWIILLIIVIILLAVATVVWFAFLKK
ncbi:MAG: hypothetical protein Q8M97_03870 [Methanobacteriaceae archaeon]|nr:hypothetical protein [Methanobacteriaceae archaeon]